MIFCLSLGTMQLYIVGNWCLGMIMVNSQFQNTDSSLYLYGGGGGGGGGGERERKERQIE